MVGDGGDAQPELIEVSDRVAPLRAVFEKARPIPEPVQVRLAAAAVLSLGTRVGTLLWLRRRTE